MQMLFRFLILLIVCNVYSQKQDFVPVKPIRSYQIKIENLNGRHLHLYNDEENIALTGKYEITFFFLDNSKKDSLISDNGIIRKTLHHDAKYSRYSRLNINTIGKFIKGYKNDSWKTLYKNKIVKTENWKNGLIKGKYCVYNASGSILYKTTFGTQGNGKYKDFYYKTGMLKEEGNYENGKKEGEWCTYNKQGNTKEIVYYKNGTVIKK